MLLVDLDQGRLKYPIAYLLAGFCGQLDESQPSLLPGIIPPSELTFSFDEARHLYLLCRASPNVSGASFDSLAATGKPESNNLGALNGSRSLKAKPPLGNIQDDATVISAQIHVGKLFHGHPWSLASFRLSH
jgi:hypothetical protein